jgi:hypothetical protein
MATRSTIALEYADGTIHQVYCHWDGYIANNGEILTRDYMDPFKVQKLMDLGDMSVLKPEVDECEFYGRDRGETDTSSNKYEDINDYFTNSVGEEYDYILRTDGNWYVRCYSSDGGWDLVSDVMSREAGNE